MATGTGKTYTAFQIVYKLFKSKAKKRVLYLADRNILVEQTIGGDFKPLKNSDNIHWIKNRKVDKSREIQFALYQSLTGDSEEKKVYKKYSPDYFDLIIVDECHRRSAKDEMKRIVDKVKIMIQICDELELRIEKSKKYSEQLMESILKDSFKA